MSQINANHIVEVFNQCFEHKYNTVLQGGFQEPYYEVQKDKAVICFREDFAASALHEVAHWCVAGSERRKQNDYGYWYEGERDLAGQQRFEAVEVKPQALEWIFSQAAGLTFRVSADNLSLVGYDSEPFRCAVQAEVKRRLEVGLNRRAQQFTSALTKRSGQIHVLCKQNFQELPN